METTARTEGVHHVGLTVPDVTGARRFFEEALGFHLVREREDYPAAFVSDGSVMLTLWQASDPSKAQPADRHHILGLHHLALRVRAPEKLDRLHESLRARDDVRVEFGPEPLGAGPTRHMMFLLPGNIRIELIAPEV